MKVVLRNWPSSKKAPAKTDIIAANKNHTVATATQPLILAEPAPATVLVGARPAPLVIGVLKPSLNDIANLFVVLVTNRSPPSPTNIKATMKPPTSTHNAVSTTPRASTIS